jgi:glycosyltransferase involved in cell wall biosynthesis
VPAGPAPPPARIALISTHYHPIIGGAEAAAERLAIHLAHTGHDVTVITRRPSGDVVARERRDGVDVWRLEPAGQRSARGKWLWLFHLAQALRESSDRYDLVCAVDHRATGLVALWHRRRTGCPIVFVPHTLGSLDGRHPYKHGLPALVHRVVTWPVRLAYARADAIVCITRSIGDEARTMGVPPARLHYVPNPVDTTQFAPLSSVDRAAARATYGVQEGDVLFVFVGRLSREKGVRELLEAWTVVARPGRRLLIAGPDMPGHPWDEGAWARRFVSDAGLGGSVTLLGPRPHDDVARLLGAADVGVLPSHFEAQPVAAIEAMACGLPLVASRVGGVPDFVEHERNGLLVEPRDVPALGAALERMAGDPDLRQRLGARARQTVERFDAGVVLGRFAALLDELAATRGASRKTRPA